jgi:hypothetical protein
MRTPGWLSAGARWLAGPAQGHGKTDDDSDKSNAARVAFQSHQGNACLLVEACHAPASAGLERDLPTDEWIENYLSFLARENRKLGSGTIGAHYLKCAYALYDQFRNSERPGARYRTWLAIRTCCQWLAQLYNARRGEDGLRAGGDQ